MGGNLLKTEIRGAMKPMRKLLDLAKDCMQFITSHISELHCLTHVKKANNLVELFKTTASAISEIENCFEITVTVIKERVRALTDMYSATNLVE
ncbi:hypothetical protein TNIN_237921 [Trichonephila inaurata madagascariensis]|uniref:Uncharacterized protein n=1 Tax=Trichonephila inaurata madagascariensis TaxID=2747483 RepID=A0A8X7CJF1_9ARAC|nr:hypothetical protein TNIN_237921 [Trichonephila inaurata madagascariensis]